MLLAILFNTKGNCAMNGQTEKLLVLDSCICMGIAKGTIPQMDNARRFISVITRMELYSKRNLSTDERQCIDSLVAAATVVPLDAEIERVAIDIRRFGSPCPKLPDAIIAATAIVLDAPLVSLDDKLLKLNYPGLTVQSGEERGRFRGLAAE
jgi:predicted nucleic acid-binding protein